MAESLRIGTRGSALALAQSGQIADAITARTGVPVELVRFTTRGDRIRDRPLPEVGGKGLFTAELEAALRDGRIDLAVHSLKDLPTDDPDGLVLGAIPERADPRDALVGPSLDALAQGAVLGTGSLRRRVQISAMRPDLDIRDIRGNVGTRLRKRDEGQFDATILAMAGLVRLGIERPDVHALDVGRMIPAVGQGALGVQCRAGDARVLDLLKQVDHEATRHCVTAERAFLARVGGGCNVPAGCHVVVDGAGFHGRACLQRNDAALRIASAHGDDPVALGWSLARELSAEG
jgi:hydroxymethylbilane synthase